MGIPGLARSIENSNDFKKYKVVTYELNSEIDHLLFDFNGILYAIERTIKSKYKGNDTKYERLLINKTIDYMEKLICEMIKPNKSVFIAIDGPVPRAKIYIQRMRRFKTTIEMELHNKIKKNNDIPIVKSWGTSAHLIPGSKFMNKLEKAFKKAIKEKRFCKHNDITVVLSSGSVPGEGEHKLMEVIRKMNKSKKMKDDSIALFSPDGDLIVLLLISNKSNVHLVDNAKDKDHNKLLDKLKYTDITKYGIALKSLIRTKMDNKDFYIDSNVIKCFIGNDFVKSFIITSSKQFKMSMTKVILPNYDNAIINLKNLC